VAPHSAMKFLNIKLMTVFAYNIAEVHQFPRNGWSWNFRIFAMRWWPHFFLRHPICIFIILQRGKMHVLVPHCWLCHWIFQTFYHWYWAVTNIKLTQIATASCIQCQHYCERDIQQENEIINSVVVLFNSYARVHFLVLIRYYPVCQKLFTSALFSK